FFFSSRRRHTRFSRDWSSDVCSSDLGVPDVHPLYEYHNRVGVGPYGESKVQAEEVCEEYRAKGLPICILRPKSFIGTARLGVFQIGRASCRERVCITGVVVSSNEKED